VLVPAQLPDSLAGAQLGLRLRRQFAVPGRSAEKGERRNGTDACNEPWLTEEGVQPIAALQQALGGVRDAAVAAGSAHAGGMMEAAGACAAALQSAAARASAGEQARKQAMERLRACKEGIEEAVPAGSELSGEAKALVDGAVRDAVAAFQAAEGALDRVASRYDDMKQAEDSYLGFLVTADGVGRGPDSTGFPVSGDVELALAGGFRPVDARFLSRAELHGAVHEALESERDSFDQLSGGGAGALGWSAPEEAIVSRRWYFGVDGDVAFRPGGDPTIDLGAHATLRAGIGKGNYVSLSARQAVWNDGEVTDLRGDTRYSVEWDVVPALSGLLP
jgi:hypothetical protein